jgi:hypothetical protein
MNMESFMKMGETGNLTKKKRGESVNLGTLVEQDTFKEGKRRNRKWGTWNNGTSFEDQGNFGRS